MSGQRRALRGAFQLDRYNSKRFLEKQITELNLS